MNILDDHAKRMGRTFEQGEKDSPIRDRWAGIFNPAPKREPTNAQMRLPTVQQPKIADELEMERGAEMRNDTDYERSSGEEVHNPDQTQDPLRTLEYGWDKDTPYAAEEYSRDRKKTVDVMKSPSFEHRYVKKGQAAQYYMQQNVKLQVHPNEIGNFISSEIPGMVMQVEEPGKYKIQVPGESSAGGVPTEMLAVDETYNKPDMANYTKITAPASEGPGGVVQPVQSVI